MRFLKSRRAFWEESDVILERASMQKPCPPIWKSIWGTGWKTHPGPTAHRRHSAPPAGSNVHCFSLCSPAVFFVPGVTSTWPSWTTCRGSWPRPRMRRRPWILCCAWPSSRNWPWRSAWRTWSSTTSRCGAALPRQWRERAERRAREPRRVIM